MPECFQGDAKENETIERFDLIKDETQGWSGIEAFFTPHAFSLLVFVTWNLSVSY